MSADPQLDPADVQVVLDVLREAGFYSDWRALGRRLGLNAIDVNDIERDYSRRGGVKRCLEEVIERWISEGENTWEVLADAVSQCQGKNIAKKVREKVGLAVGDQTLEVETATDSTKSSAKEEKSIPNSCSDFTPLMEASRTGDVEMAKMLLDSGANPNLTNSEGWTALMAAANNGRYGTVDILLERGADPDMQDHSGWTALMAAVFKRYDDVALRIVKAGATPHIQDNNKTNALLLAIASTGQERVVNALLDSKPDLDCRDSFGETALIFACKTRNLVLVKRLLSMGANPNICNKHNEFPAIIATAKKEKEILKELLSYGANPNLGPAPPLMVASHMGSDEITDVLLHHGADPNKKSKSGVTAGEVAEMSKHAALSSKLNPEQTPSSKPTSMFATTVQALACLQEHLSVGPLFLTDQESEKEGQWYGWGLIGKVFEAIIQ